MYEKAIELDPKNIESYFNKGKIKNSNSICKPTWILIGNINL